MQTSQARMVAAVAAILACARKDTFARQVGNSPNSLAELDAHTVLIKTQGERTAWTFS